MRACVAWGLWNELNTAQHLLTKPKLDSFHISHDVWCVIIKILDDIINDFPSLNQQVSDTFSIVISSSAIKNVNMYKKKIHLSAKYFTFQISNL